MQLGICCVISLLVVTVFAQYRNDPYRFSNFRNRWADPYGISTPYLSHEIPMIEEPSKGWTGSYRYRPFFSRVSFGAPPEIPPLPNGVQVQRPASEESHENHHEGSIGFLDWKDEPFGPPKPMEFEETFPAEDFDSQEIKEEIAAPDSNNNTGVTQEGNDFTQIKDDVNTTVANLEEDDDDVDSEEKDTEDEKDNSDKDVLLGDDDEKSKYPAPCPDLVELIPSDEKNSGEISDEVDTQSKVPVGQLVPSQPTDDLPWNISPFDYFTHERRPATRPAAITHNSGHSVIFANQDSIFDDFWNSAEGYSPIFPDDGISESPVAVVSPEPSLPPVSTSTTPQPEYKFRGSTDRPKSVYKHNYRKVPIDEKK